MARGTNSKRDMDRERNIETHRHRLLHQQAHRHADVTMKDCLLSPSHQATLKSTSPCCMSASLRVIGCMRVSTTFENDRTGGTMRKRADINE
jgi:hypothetical protein